MKHMENNYDDYGVWSPQIMENIAKKYGEQIRQKIKNEQSDNSAIIANKLLNNNLKMLENANFYSNPYARANLQKIYIKINSVKNMLNVKSLQNTTQNDNFCSENNLNDLKKLSIINLCQVCKLLTDCQSTEKILDIICEIAKL